MDEQVQRYAQLFDGLSGRYDQSGIPYFELIAGGLVSRLQVQPGEHVLEIGSGRGAATFPLAAAVGETGRVDTLDVAPGMVRHLTADTAHLPQVRVSLGDATDPRPPGAPYDVIASSLVLFFLTDPVTSLTRWRALLRPSGRLGIATFQPWRATWQALDELYDEYAGELSRSASQEDAFTTDAGVESLLDGAGFGGVRTESATYGIRFDSVEQWRDWSVGTSMGGLWTRTPEDAHPEILRRATEILEAARDDTGQIVVEVDARYTFGIA